MFSVALPYDLLLLVWLVVVVGAGASLLNCVFPNLVFSLWIDGVVSVVG